MISDAETREQLRQLYANDFEAVGNLLGFADRLFAGLELPGRKQDGIVGAEVARATNLLRAGLLLCEEGYGEQAAMICRSMFESMAVMHWVAAHPDEAVERFEKHDPPCESMEGSGAHVAAALPTRSRGMPGG